MGCGKTLTTISVAGRSYLNGLIEKLFIVVPKSVVNVWEEEFLKFADFTYTLTVLDGSSENKKRKLRSLNGDGLLVAVLNYDSVSLIEKEIVNWNPDFIVADESTRIKNPTTKVSKSIHKISKICDYRMILSGSPITQNPLDLFSQYKMLDNRIFGNSFYAFKNYYAVLGYYNQPTGYKNMKEFVEKAHSIAYRVTKEEALDLPSTIDEFYPIILEEKAKRIYKQFVKDSYIKLSKGEVTATNILTRILRLQQITGGFIKADDEKNLKYEKISNSKLEALKDIINSHIDSGKKVVVMARFIPEIDEIRKLMDKKKIEYALICGSTRDRNEEIRRFQNDKKCMIFIGQIQTASMGITLTAASTCVFYSLTYNYSDYIQARARIHRIGQDKKCVYIHLIVKDTIDETIMESLKRKEDIAKTIIDNWKNIIK